MASKCEICGKGIQRGYNVSHAHNRTKKIWRPNLQNVHVVIGGKRQQLKVCTSCLRSERIRKIG